MSASSAFSHDRGNALPIGFSRFSMQNLQWHNFSIFAPGQNARFEIRDEMGLNTLLLLDLKPQFHKTGHIWHIAIAQLPKSFSYCWCFDKSSSNSICDPRAELLASVHFWGQEQSESTIPPLESLALIAPSDDFDWQGDCPPDLKWNDVVIYEMHVRGFTQHISSQCSSKGTFKALIEKLPYLKELGVTAIELMPIQEFAEKEYRGRNPHTDQPLCNYWGYSTRHFFTPMRAYADPATSLQARFELKELVRQAHLMKIEIILDVVYNHTGEGNELGSTISFKACAEDIYYLKDSSGAFINHSGCGNTLNANHPVVAELIIASLRHWVNEYHIDGFRFDLATLLMRTPQNEIDERSAVLCAISNDPLLAKIKLIAEPWDPSGTYRVGNFPFGDRFCEWNGRFRDDVRQFLNFGRGKGNFASRLCGSQDLFAEKAPHNSINFITCHDGFSLADLVSFNQKHNEENGENNRDGFQGNLSNNFGCEGATDDPTIQSVRHRLMKNFLLVLMISQGVPLLLSGDEYGHSRDGNNNSWCQDNEKNWFCWDSAKASALPRYTRQLIALRKKYVPLKKEFLTKENVRWHGLKPDRPNWDSEDGLIALSLENGERDLYIAFNSSPVGADFEIPKPEESKSWYFAVVTSQPSPLDIHEEGQEILCVESVLNLDAHSAIVLIQLDRSKD